MKFLFWLQIIVSGLLVSCSTVTNPDYLKEQPNIRQDGHPNDIVGVWLSKTVAGGGIAGNATMHTTLSIEPGGQGNIRFRTKKSTGEDKQGECLLKWKYSGGGQWGCQYEEGRNIIHFTGTRLLVDSWFILGTTSSGYVMTSVVHREVFDRPGSKSLDQTIKKGSPTNIDWGVTQQ